MSDSASKLSGLTLAAVLAVTASVTACSAASAPASQSAPVATVASQGSISAAGDEDPGCRAVTSEASGITSQLAADSGNYSAQVPVLQTWESDLKSAAQQSQSAVVQGALNDTASGVQDVIIDEENLMDGSVSDDTQLNDDFSLYKGDLDDVETACGL
jgi:hypothetical protein